MYDPLVVYVGQCVGDLGTELGGLGSDVEGPKAARRSARLGPSTRSSTTNASPSCSPASYTCTRPGWSNPARTMASASKRGPISEGAAPEDLDRDPPLQPAVIGLIDVGRAAPGDMTDELIAPGHEGPGLLHADHLVCMPRSIGSKTQTFGRGVGGQNRLRNRKGARAYERAGSHNAICRYLFPRRHDLVRRRTTSLVGSWAVSAACLVFLTAAIAGAVTMEERDLAVVAGLVPTQSSD